MSRFGPVLITARHLLSGRHHDSKRILSNTGLVPDRVKIAHNRHEELGEWVIKEEMLRDEQGTPRWAEHPELKSKANIAALPLVEVFDVEFYPYDVVNTGPDLVVGLTDQISIIGFPFGLRGGLSFPIWANGFLASEPAVDQFDMPAFLVDCRSRPGQSGAAVVAHSNRDSVIMAGGEYRNFSGPITKLLGIFGGRVSKQADLGVVWRTSIIRDITEALGYTIQSERKKKDDSDSRDSSQMSDVG